MESEEEIEAIESTAIDPVQDRRKIDKIIEEMSPRH